MFEVFDGSIITIGSDPSSTVPLTGQAIAIEHAIIISENNQPLLINRADKTLFNNEQLVREARRAISYGDKLTLGDYLISFTNPQDEPSSQPVQEPQRKPEIGNSQKSFASILDNLRSEDDSFYFLVKGGQQSGQRIELEGSTVEMEIGLDSTNQQINFGSDPIEVSCAVIRKDWSGVTIAPQKQGIVTVNGKRIESTLQLRDNDRIQIGTQPTKTFNTETPVLIFHEPASLIALDSLLPKQLPPPINSQPTLLNDQNDNEKVEKESHQTSTPIVAEQPFLFFGIFTIFELILIVIGTLIGATIVFFILNTFLN
jgi:pSer/pThr/pTyr-binding forkhead associated (FHA) protein